MAQRITRTVLWSGGAQQWEPSNMVLGGPLTASEFTQISPHNISKLGQGQISSLGAENIAVLSSQQASALRPLQLSAIAVSQITALDPLIMRGLSNIQKEAFTATQIAAMTQTQRNELISPDPYAGTGTSLPPSSTSAGTTTVIV